MSTVMEKWANRKEASPAPVEELIILESPSISPFAVIPHNFNMRPQEIRKYEEYRGSSFYIWKCFYYVLKKKGNDPMVWVKSKTHVVEITVVNLNCIKTDAKSGKQSIFSGSLFALTALLTPQLLTRISEWGRGWPFTSKEIDNTFDYAVRGRCAHRFGTLVFNA